MSVRALTPRAQEWDRLAAGLAQLEAALVDLPLERLPAAVGEIARVQAVLTLRLSSAAGAREPDRLVGIDEAARLLSIDEGTLYRKAKSLPFTVRLGRQLRFSAAGLDRYIREKQGRQR